MAYKSKKSQTLSAAKDPGSSLGLVNRVNYRGSSPKVRAQNDSACEFFRKLFNSRFAPLRVARHGRKRFQRAVSPSTVNSGDWE